jgi:hypothetical protein
MDTDFWLHSFTGGALITAAFTLARLVVDYALRGQQRENDQRIERILQDRLAEADRRYEAERERSAVLEEELRRVNCGYRDSRR